MSDILLSKQVIEFPELYNSWSDSSSLKKSRIKQELPEDY